MVGSYLHNKNQLGLLRMLAERPQYFNRIYFVGELEPQDPSALVDVYKLKMQLEYLAKEYRLPIEFVGAIDRVHLVDFYNSVEWVVSLSMNEGCQTSIQEAMACGTNVAVQNWMGSKEIYPPWAIFTTIGEFWAKVDSFDGVEALSNVTWAKSHYSYDVVLPRIDSILEEVACESHSAT